jgi:hypothetical protein
MREDDVYIFAAPNPSGSTNLQSFQVVRGLVFSFSFVLKAKTLLFFKATARSTSRGHSRRSISYQKS